MGHTRSRAFIDPNEKIANATKLKLQNENKEMLREFKNNFIIRDYHDRSKVGMEVRSTITKRKINREYKDRSKYEGEVTFDGTRSGKSILSCYT